MDLTPTSPDKTTLLMLLDKYKFWLLFSPSIVLLKSAFIFDSIFYIFKTRSGKSVEENSRFPTLFYI